LAALCAEEGADMGDPYKRDRRLGRVSVWREYLEEVGPILQREMLLVGLVPDWSRDALTYTGTHPSFEIVPQGCEIPRYTIVLHRNPGMPEKAEISFVAAHDNNDPDLRFEPRKAPT
jgi:hypothetical protein